MEKNYDKETTMTPIQYMKAVDDIVEKHFDENGNYQPHWGKLGLISVFYQNFFSDEQIDQDRLNELLNDAEFIRKFNGCIDGTEDYGILNFHRAYEDAMKIVDQRIGLPWQLKETAKYITDKIADLFEKNMTPDAVDKFGMLAEFAGKDNTLQDAIATELINKFKDVQAERDPTTELIRKTGNVKQFKKKESE